MPHTGRYIHQDGRISEYVPDEQGHAPIPDWKRYEALRPVLPPRDQARLADGE